MPRAPFNSPRKLLPDHHEQSFRELLQSAKSNLPEYGDGAQIFDRCVKPAEVDLLGVTAHYAIASMFHRPGDGDLVNCYEIKHRLRTSASNLDAPALPSAPPTSVPALPASSSDVTFGVLHFGDHNLMAGIRIYPGEAEFQLYASRSCANRFTRPTFRPCLRLLDRHFGGADLHPQVAFPRRAPESRQQAPGLNHGRSRGCLQSASTSTMLP